MSCLKFYMENVSWQNVFYTRFCLFWLPRTRLETILVIHPGGFIIAVGVERGLHLNVIPATGRTTYQHVTKFHAIDASVINV